MKKLTIVFLCAWAVFLAGAASAAEQDGLKTSLNIGLTVTDGNSDTLQGNASLTTEGEKEGLGSVLAGIEGKYGETKSQTTGENERTLASVKAYANAKKTLTRMVFFSLSGELLYDEIAKIDYRFILSPGMGAYLLKNESASLSLDAGPAYLWEKLDGNNNDYVALRFGERFELDLSETAKLWQSLEFVPRADEWEDYLLTAEIGMEAAINSWASLRLVLQNKYDNQPAPEMERNDLTLIAGLGITL